MYQTDLKDHEWAFLEPFFERPDPRGARSKYTKRSIANGILYVVLGGIQWRMMPHDLPPWQTVYNHFWRLCERGVWIEILRYVVKKRRIKEGRNPNPSYGIIDSQSIKTQYNGEKRGYDGGKKNKRKKATSCD